MLNMDASCSRLSKLVIWVCAATALLVLTDRVWSQTAFDQAHELLKQWAYAQKQAQQQKPSEAHLNRLRELTDSIAQEVPQLLKKGVIELLNEPGKHSPEELRAKLRATLQVFPPDQYEPEVFVFPVGFTQRAFYLIAYNVSYCASCSHAWIGIIGRRSGGYDILSEESDSFSGKSLRVEPLARSEDGRDRFLIYGTNWGDAHSRLSAAAYVLDDSKLKRFWARADLPQGSIKVTPTQISVSFLTALRPPWRERTEVYEVQRGEEIKLQNSFERPNP